MGTKGQGLDKGRKVLTRCGTLRQLARVVLAPRAPQISGSWSPRANTRCG